MIKPINRNQASLSQQAELATPKDKAVITDLTDTLKAHQENCVGMAANMIGSRKRIIIVQMGLLPVILVNPQITAKKQAYSAQEGCLSLLGERKTTRYQTIQVNYQNQQFQPQSQTFSGTIARIIQHEVDHCDGILI